MRKQTLTKFFRLVGVGSALLLPTLVWADAAPLVGDTFINPGIASNFGGLPAINVGGTGSQGLLLFDVTGIPSGSTITFARLRFYVNSAAATGAVDVYTASAPWTESSVTGTSGVGLGTLVQSGIAIGGAGYVTVDVTAQTQLWVNGSTNTGFLINANPSTTSMAIDTKENVATSHPAVLEMVLVGTGGATGPQGFPGAAGPTGPTGPTGPVGATGANGPAGATGAIGGNGPAGPTGATGPAGPLGAGGPGGANGGTGPQGGAGPAGPTGSTGARGAVGPGGGTGPAGGTGPVGATGNTGAQGALGNTGGTGPLGNTGATGPQGANGATGAAGNTGSTGPNGNGGGVGVVGPQGHAGPSFSNIFDTTVITNNTAITDASTQHLFMVDNSAGAVSVTLPRANVAGKYIRLMPTQAPQSNAVTVKAAGTDHILQCCSPGFVTSLSNISRGIALISDGAGNWYVAEAE